MAKLYKTLTDITGSQSIAGDMRRKARGSATAAKLGTEPASSQGKPSNQILQKIQSQNRKEH